MAALRNKEEVHIRREMEIEYDEDSGQIEYLRPLARLTSKAGAIPLRFVALRQATGKVLYRSAQLPDLSIFEQEVY
jgi:hypothetical protein